MKSYFKLPLYLGLAVLVFSVIVSAIKVGSQQAFTSQKTKASAGGAKLSLQYTPPNLVSVFLTSDKPVSGADVTLKFNIDQVDILPSSLSPGISFVTSGGSVDKNAGTFTFSALSKKTSVSNGIVATFSVVPVSGKSAADADLQFNGVGTVTVVLDKVSRQNTLSDGQGLKFTVRPK